MVGKMFVTTEVESAWVVLSGKGQVHIAPWSGTSSIGVHAAPTLLQQLLISSPVSSRQPFFVQSLCALLGQIALLFCCHCSVLVITLCSYTAHSQ